MLLIDYIHDRMKHFIIFNSSNSCGEGLFCAGEKNFLLSDLSGFFLPNPGQLVSLNSGLNISNCEKNLYWKGYFCQGFRLGLIQIESLDFDAKSREFSPIQIVSKNVSNNVNQWKRWGNSRFGRFRGYIELNETTEVKFNTSLPSEIKLKLEKNSKNFDFAVINLNLKRNGYVEVLSVYNQKIETYEKNLNIDLMSKKNICGANNYDSGLKRLSLVLVADCILRIRIQVRKNNKLVLFIKFD